MKLYLRKPDCSITKDIKNKMLDPLWQLVEVEYINSTDPFLLTLEGEMITDPQKIVDYLTTHANLMPDAIEQLKNAKQALVKIYDETMKGGQVKAPDALIDHRRQICLACPYNKKGWFADRCTRCGCGIKAKTAVYMEACPEGKW